MTKFLMACVFLFSSGYPACLAAGNEWDPVNDPIRAQQRWRLQAALQDIVERMGGGTVDFGDGLPPMQVDAAKPRPRFFVIKKAPETEQFRLCDAFGSLLKKLILPLVVLSAADLSAIILSEKTGEINRKELLADLRDKKIVIGDKIKLKRLPPAAILSKTKTHITDVNGKDVEARTLQLKKDEQKINFFVLNDGTLMPAPGEALKAHLKALDWTKLHWKSFTNYLSSFEWPELPNSKN